MLMNTTPDGTPGVVLHIDRLFPRAFFLCFFNRLFPGIPSNAINLISSIKTKVKQSDDNLCMASLILKKIQLRPGTNLYSDNCNLILKKKKQHVHRASILMKNRVMGIVSGSRFVVLLLLSCYCIKFGTAMDTITSSNSIKDPGAITSNSGVFRPYWRTGPWNGLIFTGVEHMYSFYLDGFNLVDDKEGNFYIMFGLVGKSYLLYLYLNSQGKLIQRDWDEGKRDWNISWSAPETECDVYGKCGAFGSCDSQKQPICSCLRGFEPKITKEWTRGNWASGCVRSKPLQCERTNNGSKPSKDGFLKLEKMKVPDFAEWSPTLEDKCKEQCLNNCSCVAYAYDAGIGCMSWSENLIDMQKLSTGGLDLYVRLEHSELDTTKERNMIIIITVLIGIIIIAISTFFLWRRKAKQRGSVHCTNCFLGTLKDGQEIAVKRLSTGSGQGSEEFMTEVSVISTLQHRNLVRLLGCCVEGGERVLVYEYMPNRSLDAFLFENSFINKIIFANFQAWQLWNEDDIMALPYTDQCHFQEIKRCMHVGLLCVQEFAKDRPTISTVISMLNSEIVDLPTPKQPAFIERMIAVDIESPQNNQNRCSINDVTVTNVEGR
ncbi:hypothetical protein SCA6_002636 [Theobroma cacao]